MSGHLLLLPVVARSRVYLSQRLSLGIDSEMNGVRRCLETGTIATGLVSLRLDSLKVETILEKVHNK